MTMPAQSDPGRRRSALRAVRVLLVVRAVVVIALGLAWLISGHNVPMLGNLMATYFLAVGLMTVLWLRAHPQAGASWLPAVGAAVAIGGAVLILARILIERATSTDVALMVIGCATLGIGALRLAGAFHDGMTDQPRSLVVRRVVLGLSEVGIGVLFIVARDVDRTLTTSVGLWALVGGTIMLIDAIAIVRARRVPSRTDG